MFSGSKLQSIHLDRDLNPAPSMNKVVYVSIMYCVYFIYQYHCGYIFYARDSMTSPQQSQAGQTTLTSKVDL